MGERGGEKLASFYTSVSRCKPDCKRKKLVTIIIMVPCCGSLIEICHFGRINAARRALRGKHGRVQTCKLVDVPESTVLAQS